MMGHMTIDTVAPFNNGDRSHTEVASVTGAQLFGVSGLRGGKIDWAGTNEHGTRLGFCDKLSGQRRDGYWGPEGYLRRLGLMGVIVVRGSGKPHNIMRIEVDGERIPVSSVDELVQWARTVTI